MNRPFFRVVSPEIAATGAFILLIAAAFTGFSKWFVLALLVGVVVPVGLFRHIFPKAGLFAVALANLLAVYACIYVFFIESNFKEAEVPEQAIAFLLPIAAFVGACLWHRKKVQRLAEAGRPSVPPLGLHLTWLVPVFVIGAATFALPEQLPRGQAASALLLAMAVIALIVGYFTDDIAIFLLDTGLLFEAFFRNLGRLVVPVFAFFSVYSLLVIVFAALYSLVDLIQPGAQFSISGQERTITFAESLYFSVVTMSTVGYGDILPVSNSVRFLAVVEVVSGLLLLLFGFAELIRSDSAREQR